MTGSVTGNHGARRFDRFGEAAAHRAENECWNIALWAQRNIGGFAREFGTLIKLETGFFQKFSGETQVFGAVHAPKPELFFMALEEVQGLFELFHGAIERRGQKEYAQVPSMAWVMNLDANAILAVLIALHAAAIVITGGRSGS